MVRAAWTSLRCSACGWVDKNSRDSQAGFCCVACGFTCNADTNASINIAAGHAGGTSVGVREPQLRASLTGRMRLESAAFQVGEGVKAHAYHASFDRTAHESRVAISLSPRTSARAQEKCCGKCASSGRCPALTCACFSNCR